MGDFDTLKNAGELIGQAEVIEVGQYLQVPRSTMGSLIREASTLRVELEASRETNKRLNRRVQEAEAAVPDYKKLIAVPPNGDGVRFVQGSLGRALLAAHASRLSTELDRVREALQRIYGRMDLLEQFDPVINRICEEALDTKEVGDG